MVHNQWETHASTHTEEREKADRRNRPAPSSQAADSRALGQRARRPREALWSREATGRGPGSFKQGCNGSAECGTRRSQRKDRCLGRLRYGASPPAHVDERGYSSLTPEGKAAVRTPHEAGPQETQWESPPEHPGPQSSCYRTLHNFGFSGFQSLRLTPVLSSARPWAACCCGQALGFLAVSWLSCVTLGKWHDLSGCEWDEPPRTCCVDPANPLISRESPSYSGSSDWVGV